MSCLGIKDSFTCSLRHKKCRILITTNSNIEKESVVFNKMLLSNFVKKADEQTKQAISCKNINCDLFRLDDDAPGKLFAPSRSIAKPFTSHSYFMRTNSRNN